MAADISDRNDLVIFYLQVAPIFPTKFLVNWIFVSGDEGQNRFSRWSPSRPSWISDRNAFSHFLPLPLYFLPNFELIGSGDVGQNRFSRRPQWRPFWISNGNDFSYFLSTSRPDTYYQVSSPLTFQFRRRIAK